MSTDWLLEEYKLLQSKIDKIGEDRFKVRTWSVTITMGLSLGARISATFSPVTLVFALLTVSIFHLVEHKQRGLGRKLGDRALKLEALIRNRGDVNGIQNDETPAHFPEIAGKLRTWASSEYKRKISQRWSIWDWCVVRADNVFYCVQYVMLGVALCVLTFYVG